jgi:hypothetical protein
MVNRKSPCSVKKHVRAESAMRLMDAWWPADRSSNGARGGGGRAGTGPRREQALAATTSAMPFGFLFHPLRQINAKEVNRVRARKG